MFGAKLKSFGKSAGKFFLTISLACLFAAPLFAERLPIKTYTVADGLLRDNVYKIKQDSRGFLWFCTLEGISRFDGYGFTNFTTDDGLPDRHVNDFLETRQGDYLIATDDGLAILNPKGLRGAAEDPLFSVYLPENPQAKIISVLFEDRQGTVWVGTSGGLFRFVGKDNQFAFENVILSETLPEKDSLGIVCLVKDRRGALWIGTLSNGLFRLLPDGQVEHFTTANNLPSNNIASLLEDKDGRIWAGMRSHSDNFGGLCLLVAEPNVNQKIVERNYTVSDGLPTNWVSALYQTSDGKFWVGTAGGLCLWQDSGDSVCKTYTAKNDLCDSETWSITEDKDGNLWTGTRCGAKKKARYGFTTYTTEDGLRNNAVNSIFENRDGELFVSVNVAKRPVSRFDGAGFTLVKPNFPPSVDIYGWGWKQTVLQDSAGDWWFPTGRGLYRFPKPARFEDLAITTPQKIDTGANDSEVFRIFEDSRGDIWIATTQPNELLRWERAANNWHNYTQEAGFSSRRIGTAFVEDKFGNLWIATGEDDSALIRYRNGQFKVFTQTDGAPKGWTRDLFLDHAGRLWLASLVGLLRLDNTNDDSLQFVKYTTAEGLSSNGVTCVTEDASGRIYIGTARGLDRLNPQSGQVENFTTADGLPDSDVQLAYRDRNNALWFATANGVARFIPEPERQRMPPTILVTGLRVAGLVQPISILGETEISNIELNSDERQVTIEFVGLGANLGEKLRYEYRLGGERTEWIPTTERTLNFANLASGDYRFEIRSVTADRIYSQTPASVSLRIATPIWQRWWFIAGLSALLIFSVYLFSRYRLSRLLEMERMRTRIATDLHDDIGANLTRISLLSEVAKQKSENGSGSLLTSIADIARESVASMNDIVWAISPDHDSLLDLTRRMRQHAEEVFSFREIDLDFNAPASDLKLSVGVRRDVLLIFKEAVNNAAKHSDCSKVEIDFRVEHSILSLRIKDNGSGFDSENQTSDGQGLRSMTRRARALGGKLEIQSNDGTTIKFESPLPKLSFESRR